MARTHNAATVTTLASTEHWEVRVVCALSTTTYRNLSVLLLKQPKVVIDSSTFDVSQCKIRKSMECLMNTAKLEK